MLDLFSETFAATGGFAGDGAAKLLGKPRIDPFQTVLREAIQNSWDARDTRRQLGITVGLRTLEGQEAALLRTAMAADLPPSQSGKSRESLERFLSSRRPRVLEICDFGSKGLGGPTRSDLPRSSGDQTDFVDFFRDIGSPQDKPQGGGTYGYGKSALYLASGCSSILVDTLTTDQRRSVRRFMGCHIGASYSVARGGQRGRYTGRHWWGKADPDSASAIEPIEGDRAEKLAEGLGFPARTAKRSGTTVCILDPFLGDEFFDSSTLDVDVAARKLAETLLWHFWPKMIVRESGSPDISFELVVERQRIALPDPAQCHPVSHFVKAYRDLKSPAGREIRTRTKDSRLVGRLGQHRAVAEERSQGILSPSISLIPDRLSHIAVMRPVELVVRYFEFAADPHGRIDSAGVFICDDAEDVEVAFAKSEPPAHDDWSVDDLPKASLAKRYVKAAIDAVNEAGSAWFAPSIPPRAEGVDGLAEPAALLGRFLPGSKPKTLRDKKQLKPTGTGRGAARARRIGPVSPTGLVEPVGDQPVRARFRFEVKSVGDESALDLICRPYLVRDGIPDRKGGPATPNGSEVAVTRWMDANGMEVGSGPTVTLKTIGWHEVWVAIPDVVAVAVELEIAD